jgi:hypothetical protein
MTSEIDSVPKLIVTNYPFWKSNMFDVLRGKNISRIVNGVSMKPTYVKELAIWEDHYEWEICLIGKIVLDSLQDHIEAKEISVTV